MMIHGRIVRFVLILICTTLNLACNLTSQPLPIPNPDISGDNSAENTPTTPPSPVVTPTDPVVSPEPEVNTAEIPSYYHALGIRAAVDMRSHDTEVVHQFGGTCSAFATAAAMDNRFRQKGIRKNISERHLWSLYKQYDADYAVEAAAKSYVTEEQYWPISGTRNPNYKDYAALKITQFKQHEYNMDAALQGLSEGHPLVMAVQVPRGLANCEAVIGGNSSYTKGQHVVAAVGYKLDAKVAGGGYFIVKNSWGKECGDNGYHYYSFDLCKRNDLYCYFIEVKDVEARTM